MEVRLDLAAARNTLQEYSREKLNVTSVVIADWSSVCACAYALEVETIMEGSKQAVQMQNGLYFAPEGAAPPLKGRKWDWAETKGPGRGSSPCQRKTGAPCMQFWTRTRPDGISLKDARLLIELSGSNSTMLPAGGDDIVYLRSGTHPLLQYLRESQVRL